jgi:hypothetical protein
MLLQCTSTCALVRSMVWPWIFFPKCGCLSVEGIRLGPHKTAATGVVNTGTGILKDLRTGIKSPQRSERRAPQNVTWAQTPDIVCRVPKSTLVL